jgi:hypothetical protein
MPTDMPPDPFKNAASIEDLGKQLQLAGNFIQRMGCLDKAGRILERCLQGGLLRLETRGDTGLGVLVDADSDNAITGLTPEEYGALKFLLENKQS